jgi:hypothetical protein
MLPPVRARGGWDATAAPPASGGEGEGEGEGEVENPSSRTTVLAVVALLLKPCSSAEAPGAAAAGETIGALCGAGTGEGDGAALEDEEGPP